MVFHDFFQFVGKLWLIHVINTQSTTGNFVFVRRANTAACRADFRVTTLNFTRLIQSDMIWQNQWASVRNTQTIHHRYAAIFQCADLF